MANKKESKISEDNQDKRLSSKVKERLKRSGGHFKSELKKALFTAFIAAFGFLIALEWRELIQTYVDSIVGSSPVQGQLVSALIVTVVAVLGIILTTKFFKED